MPPLVLVCRWAVACVLADVAAVEVHGPEVHGPVPVRDKIDPIFIPHGVVAFPGIIVPLHFFEPRYRQLVHDCVEDERLVAVSHTQASTKSGFSDRRP